MTKEQLEAINKANSEANNVFAKKTVKKGKKSTKKGKK